MRPDAVVVNRLQPTPEHAERQELARTARELGLELSSEAIAAVERAAEDDRLRAAFEAEQLQVLDRSLAGEPLAIFRVPVLATDVHDVRGLAGVATLLFS